MKRFNRLTLLLTVVFVLVLMLVLTVSAAAALPELSVKVESYVYGSERSEPIVTGNLENGEERF